MDSGDDMSNPALDAATLQFDARQGERTIAKVCDFIGRFVVYPSEAAQIAHALWIFHTHLMDKWDSTPRLAFLSPEPASGKTRAMEVTELLVPNPVSAVNVSPAYLFRKVGSQEGATILFDEIDTVFGPKAKENEEIRGLLNAGHRRGAVAGRCVVHGKTVMTEEIPAYAAVALAGLGWLPDTILTRSVVIRMRRRHAGEQVEPFRRRIHAPKGERIRCLIEVWTKGVASDITWPDLPSEIQDRDADVWEPLIAIADAIGGDWPKRARDAAIALVAAGKERDASLGIRLLADLQAIFGDVDMMPSKTILEKLANIEEAPWADIKGKPLNERGLARRLKEYAVRSKNLKTDGGAVAKGYTRADLSDAWGRYLPPISANSATSATSATPHSVAQVAQVADLLASGDGPLCDTCGKPSSPQNPLLDVASGGKAGRAHRYCLEAWRAGQGCQWTEGIARFTAQSPWNEIPPHRWRQFVADCKHFSEPDNVWAARATEMGWDALALFGCHRDRPLMYLGSAGLVWAINGGKVIKLERDWAVIEVLDGSQRVFHRRRQDLKVITLPWTGLPPRAGR